MKFVSTSPTLKRMDDLIRPFHPYLQKEDEVYEGIQGSKSNRRKLHCFSPRRSFEKTALAI